MGKNNKKLPPPAKYTSKLTSAVENNDQKQIYDFDKSDPLEGELRRAAVQVVKNGTKAPQKSGQLAS